MASNASSPLLHSSEHAQRDGNSNPIRQSIAWLAPGSGSAAALHRTRTRTQRFLTSKTGHYAVLLLVSLDVSCIFADFIINLFVCDQKHPDRRWGEAQDALGVVSLVFSCLFMVELLAAVWAFGLKLAIHPPPLVSFVRRQNEWR